MNLEMPGASEFEHVVKEALDTGELTEEELDNQENDKEYAIRPKYGNKCWCELLNYRVHDI